MPDARRARPVACHRGNGASAATAGASAAVGPTSRPWFSSRKNFQGDRLAIAISEDLARWTLGTGRQGSPAGLEGVPPGIMPARGVRDGTAMIILQQRELL